MKLRCTLFLLVEIFCGYSAVAQSSISGTVKDSIGQPVPFCNVFIKSAANQAISGFTNTDAEGKYMLSTAKTGNFEINFSALSYKQSIIPIQIESGKKYIQNAILKTVVMDLNEVIIPNERPIIVKKDTIIIDAKSFAKGNETVVEDLLKKLPGINVSADGTIKIGDREIEKVMVEGDDFFEHGYKILTKNMNANVVDKVEVYQKYSGNRLLKGIENSDKVALNLTLKKNLRLQWFGNVSAGYGVISENRYEMRTNLMSFGKKAKYYLIGNLNNTGTDATGDVNQFIYPLNFDEPGDTGNEEKTASLMNIENAIPSLKQDKYNFNNAELACLNTIFTLTPKIKLKALGFFNSDEHHFYRTGFQAFTIGNDSFTNTETYFSQDKQMRGFGKIELKYDISKTRMFEYVGKYNSDERDTQSDLSFNSEASNEELSERGQFTDHKIIYTDKLKENKVLIFTGRYLYDLRPQQYRNSMFLFQDLFPGHSNADGISQESENKMQYGAMQAHLLCKAKNQNLFELKTGYEFRQDELESGLTVLENDSASALSPDYGNQVKYTAGDLYLSSKYTYKYKSLTFLGSLELHQLFNKRITLEARKEQSPFFANPKIGLSWDINKNNRINTFYSYNKSNAKILDLYDHYILTGYRNFEKGTGNFSQLQTNTAFVNYALGGWSRKFFANTSFFYFKNNDFFTTNSIVRPDYMQSAKILIKNREMWSITANADYFFKSISSNLKTNFGYSCSGYRNIVNEEWRSIKSSNYYYGLELRSGFNGFFNFHVGTKWTVTEIKMPAINHTRDNVSFMDLSLVFSKRLSADIQSERYYFGSLDTGNTYYFLDVGAKYVFSENKLAVSISGKNLFNTEKFRQYYISDLAVSGTQYRLLPRYAMLKMDYRF